MSCRFWHYFPMPFGVILRVTTTRRLVVLDIFSYCQACPQIRVLINNLQLQNTKFTTTVKWIQERLSICLLGKIRSNFVRSGKLLVYIYICLWVFIVWPTCQLMGINHWRANNALVIKVIVMNVKIQYIEVILHWISLGLYIITKYFYLIYDNGNLHPFKTHTCICLLKDVSNAFYIANPVSVGFFYLPFFWLDHSAYPCVK